MRRAIDYAHLIGKYIRMERDDPIEGPAFHGMEAFIVAVWDFTAPDGRRGVEICGDEGFGYAIWEAEEEEWHFAIAANEPAMRDMWGRIPQTFGTAQKVRGLGNEQRGD
jgi:hypothetical protein